METLDVTKIEPRLKHPTIFEKFAGLCENEHFILHNDHDPMPLRFQMQSELGKVFTWEYILQGPEVWEVKITKTPLQEEVEDRSTIGELVVEDYRKAEVFRKHGLDFCCGGKRSVQEACVKRGVDYKLVKADLDELDRDQGTSKENFNDWELDFLCDFIVNKHHKYVTEAIPMLLEFSAKVARVHGERHPETIDIAHYFKNVADELLSHMPKEEGVLFPYIKQLVAAKRAGTTVPKPDFGTIVNPINMMEAEHLDAGDDMEKVHDLSNVYQPPADACNTFRVLYAKLAEFEKDLHQHIHLENNILFKKSIELEKEVMAN